MGRFVLCCSIFGLLSLPVLMPSPAVAQSSNSNCQIVSSQSGQLFANSPLATKLESFSADSWIRLKCPGKITGRLRLFLKSAKQLSNAAVRFKLVSGNGIFTSSTSEYADTPVIIPYTNLDSQPATGEIHFQIQVVAPSGYLLMDTAAGYAVKLQVELMPN